MFISHKMKYHCNKLFARKFLLKQQKYNLHTDRFVLNLAKPLDFFDNVHCYKKLYPWKSLPEFANYLASSIVYNDNGLVAINKPYGVRIHKEFKDDSNETSDNSIPKTTTDTAIFAKETNFPYSVADALPFLETVVNRPLYIMKSTERYTSGIVLLSTDARASAYIRRSVNIARGEKIPYMVYWVITQGSPVIPYCKESVAIRFVDIPHVKKQQPEIITEYSRTMVKKKYVKPFHVEHKTISSNKTIPSSLVEIAVSGLKDNFLKMYSSNRVANILGDHEYGLKTQIFFNRPIKVNVQRQLGYSIQHLSNAMCKKLQIPPTDSGYLTVPALIHLHQMKLPKFFKTKDLIISAPPPSHFLWTCEQLDLTL